MNFCFANINSVFLRINEINNFLRVNKIDICCLAETKLKPQVHFVDGCFPGYTIYRHDRTLRRGGGVAIICRNSLVATPVAVSKERLFTVASEVLTEFAIFLVNGISFSSILVVVVYRPPRSQHFSKFLSQISDFLALAPRCLIAGDFNYDLQNADSLGHDLISSLADLDFRVIRFGSTFFHVDGSSELDFCAVSGVSVADDSIIKGDFPLVGGHLWLQFQFSFIESLGNTDDRIVKLVDV